jgi:replicative DNA helicase
METVILSNLIENEKYTRKVLPFLKEEYFSERPNLEVFNLVKKHLDKYNSLPTKEILFIELGNSTHLNESLFHEVQDCISQLEFNPNTKLEWLVNETEAFCQDKALQNALRQAIKTLDADSNLTKNSIPDILKDALSVSFDTNIGHDFLENGEERYDLYHTNEKRISFDIDLLNTITGGGLPPKTLTCWIASTGVGKTLGMCHQAAYNLMCNHNVLYITLEMAEERIAQRIDANLMGISMQELIDLSKEDYLNRISRLNKTTKGKLIIKEYPTATANVSHFRHLLNELKIKKNFIPDIVYIDYINLCSSARLKRGASNSYEYVKTIAEEIRGLAVESVLPFVTATQSNRSAVGTSDMDVDAVSDSFGLPMTLDLMLALISSEELEELNQIMIKQLKNRFNDPSLARRFTIGVDRARMKWYNLSSDEQEDLIDGPIMDNTDFGKADMERFKKPDKAKFKGWA